MDALTVLERFARANKVAHDEFNCASSLFYLLGIDSRERWHLTDDGLAIPCKLELTATTADYLITTGPHYAVLDPVDKRYIIHRNGKGAPMIRQTWESLSAEFGLRTGESLDEITKYYSLQK